MIPTLAPLEILEGNVYETRDLKCGRCGAELPSAPWPMTSNELRHRPGCPYCGSRATYPRSSTCVAKTETVAPAQTEARG